MYENDRGNPGFGQKNLFGKMLKDNLIKGRTSQKVASHLEMVNAFLYCILLSKDGLNASGRWEAVVSAIARFGWTRS